MVTETIVFWLWIDINVAERTAYSRIRDLPKTVFY